MRTSKSENLARGFFGFFEKAEFEEAAHPRDELGRWAPKEGAAIPWMEGRYSLDVDKQVKLEKERVSAIENIGKMVSTTRTKLAWSWDQLSEETKKKAENAYVENAIRRDLEKKSLREAEKEIRKPEIAHPLVTGILASGGFPEKGLKAFSYADCEAIVVLASLDKKVSIEYLMQDLSKGYGVDLPQEKVYGLATALVDGIQARRKDVQEEFKRTLPTLSPEQIQREAAYWTFMSPEGKFSFTYSSGLVTERVAAPALEEPKEYDISIVEEDEAGEGLRRFARKAAEQRFSDILEERGIRPPRSGAEDFIVNTWEAWKKSSTSESGLLLQYAAHRELGAHTRVDPATLEADPKEVDMMRAYVRAQWEVNQFIMHKAGRDSLVVYRAIILPHADAIKGNLPPGLPVAEWKKTTLPDAGSRLKYFAHRQGGAMSWTMDRDVANKWEGVLGRFDPAEQTRVVLRAWVPATAVLSLPVFGENHYKEEEVVVAGTPFRAWDAWADFAPDVAAVPEGLEKWLCIGR